MTTLIIITYQKLKLQRISRPTSSTRDKKNKNINCNFSFSIISLDIPLTDIRPGSDFYKVYNMSSFNSFIMNS